VICNLLFAPDELLLLLLCAWVEVMDCYLIYAQSVNMVQLIVSLLVVFIVS